MWLTFIFVCFRFQPELHGLGFLKARRRPVVSVLFPVAAQFLAGGKKVWVALPHPAWAEYHKRTGRMITDPLAVEIAGHYLKTALESGEGVGREMYSLTVQETLEHLEEVVARTEAVTPA